MKPVGKYYVNLQRDAIVPTPRVQTTQGMYTDQVTLNVLVDDELDWKLELAEFTADKMEYKKDMMDWAEIAPESTICSCFTALQV